MVDATYWADLESFILSQVEPPPARQQPTGIVHLMVRVHCASCGQRYETPRFIGTSTFIRFTQQARGTDQAKSFLRPYMGGHEDLPISTETESHIIRSCPQCFKPRTLAPISNVATAPEPIEALDGQPPAELEDEA